MRYLVLSEGTGIQKLLLAIVDGARELLVEALSRDHRIGFSLGNHVQGQLDEVR